MCICVHVVLQFLEVKHLFKRLVTIILISIITLLNTHIRTHARMHTHNYIHTHLGQAYVFMVGGGNYIEYQNLQDYCKRQQGAKKITYGTSELMNAQQFLTQVHVHIVMKNLTTSPVAE